MHIVARSFISTGNTFNKDNNYERLSSFYTKEIATELYKFSKIAMHPTEEILTSKREDLKFKYKSVAEYINAEYNNRTVVIRLDNDESVSFVLLLDYRPYCGETSFNYHFINDGKIDINALISVMIHNDDVYKRNWCIKDSVALYIPNRAGYTEYVNIDSDVSDIANMDMDNYKVELTDQDLYHIKRLNIFNYNGCSWWNIKIARSYYDIAKKLYPESYDSVEAYHKVYDNFDTSTINKFIEKYKCIGYQIYNDKYVNFYFEGLNNDTWVSVKFNDNGNHEVCVCNSCIQENTPIRGAYQELNRIIIFDKFEKSLVGLGLCS